MHILPITIKNKAAEYTGTDELVCYNSDYRIKFSFDADFAAYDAKTVRFWYYDTAGDKQTIDVLFTGDEVDVPVIPAAMVLYVGIYAGNIRTSTDAEIPCRYSILSPDGAELEPNPDVYHQLLEAVETQLPGALSAAGRAEKAADEAEEIVDTARDILQAAGDGIATIQDYVSEANTAANTAVDAKTAAEAARDLAKQYADDANTAKTAAETAETNAEASKTAAQGYAEAAETSANRADATSTNLRKYGNELATAMKSQYDVVVDKAIETKESARQASNNAQAAKDARDIANTFSADAKAAATRSANAADHAENYAIHQPTIGDNKNWYVWNGTEYTDTGYLSHGEAGIAPHIGDNGNWYIGETDTGVYASGSRTAVKYDEQTLTTDEQKQARRNIDAQKQVYAVSKGNPWSADDCVNAPVRDLKLYGAIEQTQYKGINLLSNNPQDWMIRRRLGWGASAGTPVNMVQSSYCAILIIAVTPNKTYSFINLDTQKYWLDRIIECDNDTNGYVNHNFYNNISQNKSEYTFTTSANTTKLYVQIRTVPVNNENIDITDSFIAENPIMLSIEVVTASDYEPYVGGIPSPNPDYPQEVKCNDLTYMLNDGADYNGGSVTAPELYAIGDVHDEWDAVTGKGIRRIKKLVLDGTENWNGNAGYNKADACNRYLSIKRALNAQARCLSNYFIYSSNPVWDAIGQPNKIMINAYSQLHINIANDVLGVDPGTNTTNEITAAFKAFLAAKYAEGNPVTVYYAIETPEPFETAPAPQLTTPDGYAHMLPTGDGIAGDVELEYAIDVEKRYVPKIYFEDIFISLTSPIMRRNIYRGKNLGAEITAEQKAAIQSGTFDDLFVGDFWTRNGKKYFIADMDFWYNMGDTAFTKHHLVMIPEGQMYSAKMNETNTTAGGYVGSLMYTEGLNQAKETINAAFGDMVLTHREYLTNAVSGHYASAGAWYDSSVELMNEIMVYGSNIFGNVANGSAVPCNYTIDKQQLALFKLNPKALHKRQNIWLRDVVSSTYFAYVSSGGGAGYGSASLSYGVRPVFPLG